MKYILRLKGNTNSGDHGHSGRPGQVGGSNPGKGATHTTSSNQADYQSSIKDATLKKHFDITHNDIKAAFSTIPGINTITSSILSSRRLSTPEIVVNVSSIKNGSFTTTIRKTNINKTISIDVWNGTGWYTNNLEYTLDDITDGFRTIGLAVTRTANT